MIPRSIGLVALCVLLASCAPQRPQGQGQIILEGTPMSADHLEAKWVRTATVARRRGDVMIFRAPDLRRVQDVEVRGAEGDGVTFQSHREGYLFGEQNLTTGDVKHFAVFEWDLVDTRRHYAAVSLADGRPLQFQASSTGTPCTGGNCLPLAQTLVIEIPDGALRNVGPKGLGLRITIADGYSFPANVPQAYARGYLQAVDAGR